MLLTAVAPEPSRTVSHRRPVIHVRPLGRLGNRMIQYLAAARLAALVPGAAISNVVMPEWSINHPPLARGREPTMVADQDDTMRLDLETAAQALGDGAIARYELAGYAQHMDNFPDRDSAGALFTPAQSYPGHDERHLVINIRGAEILDGHAWHYPLLPMAFYADLIARTGLRPVFMGQLGGDPYCTALRSRFPGAIFQPSLGPLGDFETLRRSRNIVASISTFSWLAAWLSKAQQVFLPLAGFLAPGQRPDIDLLPLDDARYRFFLLPFTPAVPVARALALHEAHAGLWREATPTMLRLIRRDAPRFAPPLDAIHPHFDEVYYLAVNTDVQRAVTAGMFDSGWEHFRSWGARETRPPFALDPVFYASRYKEAAMEVGQGGFRHFHDHWVGVGRQRGYARTG